MPKMLEGLTYWTADEIAECLELGPPGELYRKLYGFLEDAERPTPAGGDGSNGTAETPGDRIREDADDVAPAWWDKLTEYEQGRINAAYRKDYPE